jgi:DNA polymerase delta subunit 1
MSSLGKRPGGSPDAQQNNGSKRQRGNGNGDGDGDYDDEDAAAGDDAANNAPPGADDILQKGGLESWQRPAVPHRNNQHTVAMMCVDSDYIIGEQKEFAGGRHKRVNSPRVPIVRIYGVSDAGNSYMAYVHGFQLYFYVPAWPGFTNADIKVFADTLNQALLGGTREKNLTHAVLTCEVVERTSVWGYQFGRKSQLLKVTVAVPALVATARRVLGDGLTMSGTYRRFTT